MINIDVEKFSIQGNVLDMGSINYGVVYKMCKELDDTLDVDYVVETDNSIKANFYDMAIIFFNMSNLFFESDRKRLIEEARKYLTSNGELLVWDVEKKRGKKVRAEVNIIFKDGDNRLVNINRNNILGVNSLNSTKKLLQDFFDIIEVNQIENVFFIRAKKKENTL